MKFAIARSLLAASIVLICASCTSVRSIEPSVKPDMALVIVRRSGNPILEGVPTIEINGAHVVNLVTTENYTADITPGPTDIAVHNYIIPGRSVLKFTAEAGKIYRFKVSWRGETSDNQGSAFTVVESSGAYQIVGN